MFFWNPLVSDVLTNVGNLISGSSAVSKSSLSICKFLVHLLSKPSLNNFEHYLASKWNECNCTVIGTFFGIAFLWDWNENWHFLSLGHFRIFQLCWHTEYSTLTVSSFRIWYRPFGIPSPPLALFIVMLPKAHLTSYSWMSAWKWPHHSGYLDH